MNLTVCIPTFHKHELKAMSLMQQIAQLTKDLDVRIFKLPNKGEKTIGEYRQIMIDQVDTEYVVFIDADDRISPKYFELVFDGIRKGVDAIGLKGEITTNGQRPFTFIHSSKYKKWADVREKGKLTYVRPINHLNPIKTSIAKQIGYNNLKHGEDMDYSMRLSQSGLIKSEHFIDQVIYFYLYNSRK